jgi:hypothetical protein
VQHSTTILRIVNLNIDFGRRLNISQLRFILFVYEKFALFVISLALGIHSTKPYFTFCISNFSTLLTN